MPKPIENRLVEARFIIMHLQTNIELQNALAAFGYTAERIQQGETLHLAAEAHHQQKSTAYGSLRTAGDSLTATERQIKATYVEHARIARFALVNDHGALQTLHLIGRHKRSFAAWLTQAKQFYSTALADRDIQNRLTMVGLPPNLLQDGLQQVAQVESHLVLRQQREALAKKTTRERNTTMSALDSWMRNLKLVARAALSDNPQLLEQLGIVVRS